MNLSDLFPPAGHVQDLYCDGCEGYLDLVFTDFHEEVSGIDIGISGLPALRCEACKRNYLPDRSRFAVIRLHEQAVANSSLSVRVTRAKPNEHFDFTPVPFLYDSDDYRYIPGLERPWNQGFLTPVFFNKEVLIKYEASPAYRVKFASTTYGQIDGEGFYISFGINKNAKVVMWLGDLAGLPEAEQYYLRSENVESDHSIGSEFYEGQIDCIFTEVTKENKLFALRSQFVDACFKKFGAKIAHLDEEVLNLALNFNAPVIDSHKERRHVADTLNKIYIESLDNVVLADLMIKASIDPKGLGSLKRLQAIFGAIANVDDVQKILSPLYVLYDLRVAYSHLTSAEKSEQIVKSATARLNVDANSSLITIYDQLTAQLSASFEALISITGSHIDAV
jgi:hypothetical protein